VEDLSKSNDELRGEKLGNFRLKKSNIDIRNQILHEHKFNKNSTLKETACKFNSQRNCMQVQLSKKLHASSALNETACKFYSHKQNMSYKRLSLMRI
jgi:hypothetical protein